MFFGVKMDYYLALFSNRTETLDFADKCKCNRIECNVIATPKGVGSSCGICLKIFARHFQYAIKIFKMQNYVTFNSFYVARYNGKGDYNLERINVYLY